MKSHMKYTKVIKLLTSARFKPDERERERDRQRDIEYHYQTDEHLFNCRAHVNE